MINWDIAQESSINDASYNYIYIIKAFDGFGNSLGHKGSSICSY